MTNIAILSHKEDADGVVAGAIAKHWTGGTLYLTDYSKIIDTLKKIHNVDELFICDLGVNDKTINQFLAELSRIYMEGAYKIVYIDHHEVTEQQKEQIRTVLYKGVGNISGYIHGEECASILTYEFFKGYTDQDNVNMKILACCGAVMDYLDEKPIAKSLVYSFDRPFILAEATTLGFLIESMQEDEAAEQKLVWQLLTGMFPHEIRSAMEVSKNEMAGLVKMLRELPKIAQVILNLAVVDCTDTGFHGGPAASMAKSVMNVPVSFAYEKEGELYKISMRATNESPYNVAAIMKNVAARLKESGGGHPKAAGGSCSLDNIDNFIAQVADEVNRYD